MAFHLTGGEASDSRNFEILLDLGPDIATKPDGMGMGLAISRSIIEAHGGRLWATHNVPDGTPSPLGPRPADCWQRQITSQIVNPVPMSRSLLLVSRARGRHAGPILGLTLALRKERIVFDMRNDIITQLS